MVAAGRQGLGVKLETLLAVVLLIARELFLVATLITRVDDKIHGHASDDGR
ncbi:MAG: hypothetical protein ABUL60_36215 [Myxococcales bacterium]